MDLKLKGKFVLVTGASSGIGAATTCLFAEEGADVVICYHRNKTGAERTWQAIEKTNARSFLLPMDMADQASVSRGIEFIKQMERPLDAAVLCAGQNHIAPFETLSVSDWDRIINVNLNGTFNLLHALVPRMQSGGAIVTVASVAAHTGAPHHAHYAAAKAGIINLSKSAARALAPHIRVNCVAPGMTLTEMGAETAGSLPDDYAEKKLLTQRFAEPIEIARCIVFLASPLTAFCSGTTFDINGGRLLR